MNEHEWEWEKSSSVHFMTWRCKKCGWAVESSIDLQSSPPSPPSKGFLFPDGTCEELIIKKIHET